MKMTLYEALDMIERGETPEQYKKRVAKIRKLANERDFLVDAIEILSDNPNDPRLAKKKARLEKVKVMLKKLQ